MNRTVAKASAIAALCMAPLSCSGGGTAPASSSPVPTRLVAIGNGYTWDMTSDVHAGVSVRVRKPIPYRSADLPRTADLAQIGARELACDIEVTNETLAPVRIGISGTMAGRPVVPKLDGAAAVLANTSATVRRILLVPDVIAPAIRLNVAATVNDQPVGHGWTYVGAVG